MRRIIALVTIAALASVACDDPSQADLRARVVRSVGAIPAVVRAVAPGTDPKILAEVDFGVGLFNDFARDPSALSWRTAVDAWNSQVKGRLLAVGNQRLSAVVAAADILIAQVVMPEAATRGASAGAVETNFKEKDVKRLEALVKQ